MRSTRITGLVLIAIGCFVPVATYLVARIAMETIAANGGPPNQGAMVQAFLCVVASIILGLLLMATGTVAFVWSYWSSARPRR